MPRRVYWDLCTFLGLINQEPGKVNNCSAVWKEAENNDVIIYTSFFTFAEVFKVRCIDKSKPLSEDGDRQIELLLRQPFIRAIVVDELIGVAARRLLRYHTQCKKPSDGIHLATAIRLNVDEMHTFDGSDLLGLDGKVARLDGKMLKICPPLPAPSPPLPPPPSAGPLFDEL